MLAADSVRGPVGRRLRLIERLGDDVVAGTARATGMSTTTVGDATVKRLPPAPKPSGSRPISPASFGVYLDPAFFAALSRKVGVNLGGVAQAYVVAHEVAHHVRTLLGVTHRKAAADRQDPAGADARSVLFELQAERWPPCGCTPSTGTRLSPPGGIQVRFTRSAPW